MLSIDGVLLDFKRLDSLATGDTAIHRLDPRAKVLVTLVFIVTVVSFGKYELTAMVPFFIFPAVIIGLGNLPAGYIAKKIALLCPFALVVAMFNPVFDREVLVQLGPLGITGGWISCASIVFRAVLTVGAAIILLAVTGFPAICRALERLGMPAAFAVQLLFLYRYIFVLTEEGGRASRARALRSCGNKGLGMRTYGKGSVQNWVPISNNEGAVRVTIARWLTPKGRQIDKNGLNPDVYVQRSAQDRKSGRDPQLDAAVQTMMAILNQSAIPTSVPTPTPTPVP